MNVAPAAVPAPPDAPPSAVPERRAFRLRRYFSITSGIAVLAATVGLGWAFYGHEVREEIEDAEGRNVIMARTFANVIWPQFGAHLAASEADPDRLRSDPVVARLHETFRAMSHDVPVVKIKIYSLAGRAVYSSVPAEIGQDASRNTGFLAAREGRTVSELGHRDSMSGTEGPIEDVHVVSTYIPIGSGGRVDAVFELYSDVTGALSGIVATTLRLVGALVGAFAVLYASLLLIVLNADRILQRQYRQLKENEEQIQAKNRELDAANRAKSEFLSSTSHELRTPMNAILGFAELLQSEPGANLDANQSRFVHEILKAGRHLLELIDEVLDLARIEAGKMTLSVEAVAPASVIAECLPLVQNMAREKAVTLEPPPACDALVMADYMRLKQALLNLLSNAIKYNRPGGRVVLGTRPGLDGRLRITVRDTGPGIPRSQHGKLFQPFHRLAAVSGEVEGTGIGLALTRNIVEAMGGAIGFESEWGEGSLFWIELPLAAGVAAGHAGVAAAPAPAPEAHPSQRLLLYVEDNPANVLLMEQIARRLSMRFVSAHNAEIGVALAASARPDLIVMDINLPGMDGYEALELLRRDRATASIPVMALSANAMSRDVERGLAAGFVRYQTKPFHVDDMIRAITETMEAHA